jgi:hypothetical protein
MYWFSGSVCHWYTVKEFMDFFLFLMGLGFELGTKQALYRLNHTSNSFCFFSLFLADGSLTNYLLGLACDYDFPPVSIS